MDDTTLQHAAAEELEWAPHVDASHVRVAVHDGVVQLSGYVFSLAEKKAANRKIWHLRGVMGVRDDIEVRPDEAHRHPDEELAGRIRQVLLWDSFVSGAKIDVSVRDGVVTLSGPVDSPSQKEEAEQRVQQLSGVVRIDNGLVAPSPSVLAEDLRAKVVRALNRHSEIDPSGIVVDVHENQVTLSGSVRTYAQRRIAENAAWAAPGVNDVVNLMRVSS